MVIIGPFTEIARLMLIVIYKDSVSFSFPLTMTCRLFLYRCTLKILYLCVQSAIVSQDLLMQRII